MPETTPLIKAALNLRVGAGFDVYDESISFCYYSDETMENDDETILKNFSSR